MKKLIYPIIGILIALSTQVNSQTTPIEYNNTIVGEQNKITQLISEMGNQFGKDLNQSELTRKQIVTQCEQSIKRLRALGGYEKNTDFRDAGIELFTFYKSISQKEYKELIQILAKKENITKDDAKQIKALEKGLGKREKTLDKKFQSQQTLFAQKYAFTLG